MCPSTLGVLKPLKTAGFWFQLFKLHKLGLSGGIWQERKVESSSFPSHVEKWRWARRGHCRDGRPAAGGAVRCDASVKKLGGSVRSVSPLGSRILLRDRCEQAGYAKPTAVWVFEEAATLPKAIMNEILNTLSRLYRWLRMKWLIFKTRFFSFGFYNCLEKISFLAPWYALSRKADWCLGTLHL